MSLIGIAGRSYCGSTILCKLFECVPDVAAPGELHWLVDEPEGVLCRRCGSDCPLFTHEFVASRSRHDLYYAVYDRVGTEHLVIADKHREHFERFAEPKTMDGIVLVRSPYGIAASDLKRGEYGLVESLLTWEKAYGKDWDFYNKFFKSLRFVLYDDLCQNPYGTMLVLCENLGLRTDWKMPDEGLRKFPAHPIRGNPVAWRANVIRYHHYLESRTVGRSDVEVLNDTQKNVIETYPAVMDIWAMMQKYALKPLEV